MTDSEQPLIEMSRGLGLSAKNVLLSYCTVMDFGGFGTALGRNVRGVKINLTVLNPSIVGGVRRVKVNGSTLHP